MYSVRIPTARWKELVLNLTFPTNCLLMLHTVNDIKHLTFSLDNFGVYTDQFIMSS